VAGKRKKSAAPEAEKYPRKDVICRDGANEEETARNYAKLVTSPELAALRVVKGVEEKSGIGDEIDIPTLLTILHEQAATANSGDLTQPEAMLMNQATALQSLFSRLADRGMHSELLPSFEANMKMALRAQSQCRATLETLAAVKNPPVVYARQANVTSGPQQINNGAPQASHARDIENPSNKQSEVGNELLPLAFAAPILRERTEKWPQLRHDSALRRGAAFLRCGWLLSIEITRSPEAASRLKSKLVVCKLRCRNLHLFWESEFWSFDPFGKNRYVCGTSPTRAA
jgi:hypothetical protein